MSIKVIAIGNTLMGDDGVAVRVAEELKKNLELNGIKVIIGETDVDYCLSNINAGDCVAVMDATSYGITPGTVTVNLLGNVFYLRNCTGLFTQHGYSLIEAMAMRVYNQALVGILIGIEGQCFDYGLSLSAQIEQSLKKICDEVEEKITFYMVNA